MIGVHVSSVLEAREGERLRFFQTYYDLDQNSTDKIFQTSFTVAPLSSKVVTLCDVTRAKHVFVKTLEKADLADPTIPNPIPVHVQVTFDPVAPTPPPAPATQTFLVLDFLHLTTAINAMTITNPNSGTSPEQDASIEVIVVGV
jgi:hypothetical protein